MVTRRNASRQRAALPAAASPPGVDSPDQSNPVGAGSGLGGPVDYVSDLAGWQAPNYMPGSPMRLPGLVRGPVSPLIASVPSSAVPTPSLTAATVVIDPHHYANMVSGVVSPVSQAAIQVPFLTTPAALRNALQFRNTHATANIYIDFQQSASVNSPIKIAAGQTYLYDEVVPQNDVYAFADAAGVTLAYAFSNIAGTPPP